MPVRLSANASIRQHTVSIRQHTSAYVRGGDMAVRLSANAAFECLFRVRMKDWLLQELKEAVIYLFTCLCASLCERVGLGLRSRYKSYLIRHIS
jgi:hypothetical protein